MPHSLSKCLNYPGFIFLCPRKLSKHYPREKTKSLNYPNTIPEFFFWIWLCSRFFLCPKNYPGKKTNTLNYPNSIRYFEFSRILHEIKNFITCVFFVKIWQCLTLCSSQSKRQIIAKCKIKWLCSDIILCSWKKHLEYPWKNPNTLNYPILWGLSQIFLDTWNIC